MIIMRAYKTELDPNKTQHEAFMRHAGAARWAYNWGLSRKIEAREAGEKNPSYMDLGKELVVLKGIPQEEGGVPWMSEVASKVPGMALKNLDQAYSNFFRRCKEGKGKAGFPRFKSRKRGIGSFTTRGRVRVDNRQIKLPVIGWVRLKESGYIPTEGVKVKNATISERAGRWFVSVLVEEEIPDPKPRKGEIVGVDVGIKALATLPDGTMFENPKALYKAEKLLRRRQRQLARKVGGSNRIAKGTKNVKGTRHARVKPSANAIKAARKIAKLHYRIACIRKDAIHKATTAIVKRAAVIGIETLNVKGMKANHCLAKAVSDASMSEFLRQLKYKAEWVGVPVVEADRWYPSSKTCSECGNVKEKLSLSERTYKCEVCGMVLDRDVNAARTLSIMAASSAVTACGGEGSGLGNIPSETRPYEAGTSRIGMSR